MTTRTILITGCSSGIGWHCAIGMKQRGWRVLATARTDEDLKRLEAEGLEALRLDYADRDSVAACAAEVAAAPAASWMRCSTTAPMASRVRWRT